MGCAPCRAEMPALNRLVTEYKGKNVLFFGFTPDKTATLTPDFFQQSPFNFKIVADDHSAINSFHISGYPTTYIVDQRGVIRQAWMAIDQLNQLEPYYKAKAAIDSLLKTNAK